MTKNQSNSWVDIIKIILRVILGLFVLYAGISHLTFNRAEFAHLVPMWLRFSPSFTDFLVLASGVVEIVLGAAMIFWHRQRAYVGVIMAIFFVLVFPGNLNQYLYDIDAFGLTTDRARLIRLLFQPVIIVWALWATGGMSVLRRSSKQG